MGLRSTLMLADNSLRAAAEGSLICQSQSEINGPAAEFRHWIFFDNQSGQNQTKFLQRQKRKAQIAVRSVVCIGATNEARRLTNEMIRTFLPLKHVNLAGCCSVGLFLLVSLILITGVTEQQTDEL